jgi:hypothetical protein
VRDSLVVLMCALMTVAGMTASYAITCYLILGR